MAHWTTPELRKLAAMHLKGYPSRAELAAAFPRHPVNSIRSTIHRLGIRRRYSQNAWLRLAHEYFARREAGLLA